MKLVAMLSFLILGTGPFSFAGSSTTNRGYIVNVNAAAGVFGFLFAGPNQGAPPSCAPPGAQGKYATNDPILVSSLLLAKSMGLSVLVQGAGTCNTLGGFEDVGYIFY